MFKEKNRFFFIFFFLILIFSCKKEEDKIKPSVSLYTPDVDQQYNVFDEIIVSGVVEDDKYIEFIRISLLTENQLTALPAQIIVPSEKKAIFNQSIELKDINLQSGIYYVTITASDGKNESRLFRKIYISEAPRKLKGIFVITSDESSTYINLIDSTGEKKVFLTQGGDYIGSSVNSYDQIITIAGHKKGDLLSLSLIDGNQKWKESSYNQSSPTFTGLDFLNRLNYISYYNGQIKAYDENGGAKVFADAFPGFISKRIINSENRTVSYQRAITGDQKKIVSYYRSSGGFVHESAIDFEIVDFCQKSDNKVFAFGNKDGNGVLRIFEIEENNVWEPVKIGTSEINAASRINDNTYLFSTNSGLYTYKYNLNAEFLYKSGNYGKFIYDDLEGQLIVEEGNNVNFYNYSNGALISSYTFAQPIVNIHSWYNK